MFAWPPKLITADFTFDSYLAIFSDGEKLRFFLNSYIVAGAVTVLTLLASVLAAYALSRYEFPLKRALNVVLRNASLYYSLKEKKGDREKKPNGNECRILLFRPGLMLALLLAASLPQVRSFKLHSFPGKPSG